MKIALLLLAVAALAAAKPADTYTNKYDNIDLENILTNDRLYKKYFDCLTGKGKCTPDGKQLKDLLPEALATQCKKCTDRQRRGSERVLKYMIEKRPADWAVLEKIYDPQGTYRQRYRKEAEKRGLKI